MHYYADTVLPFSGTNVPSPGYVAEIYYGPTTGRIVRVNTFSSSYTTGTGYCGAAIFNVEGKSRVTITPLQNQLLIALLPNNQYVDISDTAASGGADISNAIYVIYTKLYDNATGHTITFS